MGLFHPAFNILRSLSAIALIPGGADGPTAVYRAYRADARLLTAVAVLLVFLICGIILLLQRKGK